MLNETTKRPRTSSAEGSYSTLAGTMDYSAPMAPQIYRILRAAIIESRMAPGTPIYEARLSEVMGISRTPLRSALQQLAKEGLVETRPQVGSVVAPVDERKIFAAVFCRSALETAVVRRLAEQPASKLDNLSSILAIQAECTARDDYLAFFQSDEEFHARLAELAGVPEAWQLVMSNKSHVDRARLGLQRAIPGRAAHAYKEHLEIVAALRSGHADLACALMNKHVTSALDVIMPDESSK